jgi:UDP-glucuronate 4-epimerase
VRYSLTHPHAYIDSNLVGFLHILEGCRHHGVQHLTYASSSSVYGANTAMPFSVHQNVDHPVSLYAATKKANELMAHTYSHLYGLPTTGLRFFTVYGPWGRPDMALFLFTKAILEGQPIDVFNHGQMQRDFTYIDDIVEGRDPHLRSHRRTERRVGLRRARSGHESAPYRIYNIGNNNPVELMELIRTLEALARQGSREAHAAHAAGRRAGHLRRRGSARAGRGLRAEDEIAHGVQQFVRWYREYYNIGD